AKKPAAKKAPAKVAEEAKPAAKKAPAKKAAAKKVPAKKTAAKKDASTADVTDVVETEVVLDAQGKKVLPDLPDSEFEKDLAHDPTLKKDEEDSYTLSSADETDEPAQQVMVAGATADPVKDYLKQIGKVALLNAAEEVELAKRIEAG